MGEWIQKAATRMKQRGTAGSFSARAAKEGKTTSQLAQAILSGNHSLSGSGVWRKRASFAKTAIRLSKKRKKRKKQVTEGAVTRGILIEAILQEAKSFGYTKDMEVKRRGRRAAAAAAAGLGIGTQVVVTPGAIRTALDAMGRRERTYPGKIRSNTLMSAQGGGGMYDPVTKDVHFAYSGKRLSHKDRFFLGHELGHRKNWRVVNKLSPKTRGALANVTGAGMMTGGMFGTAGVIAAKDDKTAKRAAVLGTLATAPRAADELMATGRAISRHARKYGLKGFTAQKAGFARGVGMNLASYGGLAGMPAAAYLARKASIKRQNKKLSARQGRRKIVRESSNPAYGIRENLTGGIIQEVFSAGYFAKKKLKESISTRSRAELIKKLGGEFKGWAQPHGKTYISGRMYRNAMDLGSSTGLSSPKYDKIRKGIEAEQRVLKAIDKQRLVREYRREHSAKVKASLKKKGWDTTDSPREYLLSKGTPRNKKTLKRVFLTTPKQYVTL